MERIEFICRTCGLPGSVELESTGQRSLDSSVSKLLQYLSHDECVERKKIKIASEAKIASDISRSLVWIRLCPDEFRKPINWSKGKVEQQRRKLYSSIMSWSGEKGLYVFGPSGRCKTRFCWKLMELEFAKHRLIAAFSHSDFRQRVTALARDSQTELVRWIDHFARVDIFFMDDFGKGNSTPASEESIHDLLDKRYRENKITIFTSERAIAQSCGIFSMDRREAILRRISEMTEEISV